MRLITAQDTTESCMTVHHSCACWKPWQHPWVPLRQPKPRSQPWRHRIGGSCWCCRCGSGCWRQVQALYCQGCWNWCSRCSLQRSHGSLVFFVKFWFLLFFIFYPIWAYWVSLALGSSARHPFFKTIIVSEHTQFRDAPPLRDTRLVKESRKK